MQGHMIKYARGTIWMCEDDGIDEDLMRRGFRSHVQKKTRPVLIISNNYGNAHSPVLNVIPLTSQDKRSSVAVALVSEDGSLSCILCNQIKTVDANKLISYMGTVDEETMAEVEKITQYTLGIKVPKITESLNDLEALVKNIVTMKFNELNEREDLDNMVKYIADGLESTYKNLMTNYLNVCNTATRRIKSSAPALSEIVDTKSKDKSNKTKSSSSSTVMKPKGYWTTDRKKEFVFDYDNLSMQQMMIKYGFDSEKPLKKRYYNYKYELKKANML